MKGISQAELEKMYPKLEDGEVSPEELNAPIKIEYPKDVLAMYGINIKELADLQRKENENNA
jgi:hypothetical protein